MNEKGNGWNEYEKHVLAELKRLTKSVTSLWEETTRCRLDIRELKVKSGFWGVIGGTIPVIIMLAIWYFRK